MGMMLTIIIRYFGCFVSLLAIPTFAAVYLVFVGSVASVYDRDFVVAVEIYLVMAPFATALIVIPSTVREFRKDQPPSP